MVACGLRDCLGSPNSILQLLGSYCHSPDAACVGRPEDHAVERDVGFGDAAAVVVVGGVATVAVDAAVAVDVAVVAAAAEVDTADAGAVEAVEAADSADAAAKLLPRPMDLPVHIFWEKI